MKVKFWIFFLVFGIFWNFLEFFIWIIIPSEPYLMLHLYRRPDFKQYLACCAVLCGPLWSSVVISRTRSSGPVVQ